LGTKRHVVVDRNGVPLAVTISGSNVHDSNWLEEALDAIPPLRMPGKRRGRPRQGPVKLHVDKGYDHSRCRQALRRRSIIPHGERLATHSDAHRVCWPHKRTLSLEFKPAHSVSDLLAQHLDELEQEAERKGGALQVLSDYFAKVYKIEAPSALAA
jgi:DDE family transposase